MCMRYGGVARYGAVSLAAGDGPLGLHPPGAAVPLRALTPDGPMFVLLLDRRNPSTSAEAVTVEVLDVNDEEARMLLLSMAPWPSSPATTRRSWNELRSLTSTDSDALANLWASVADGLRAAERAMKDADAKRKRDAEADAPKLVENFVVIVECGSEAEQASILDECVGNGWACRAVMS